MAHIIYPRGASYRRSSYYKLLSSLLIASFLLPVSAFAQAAPESARESTPASSRGDSSTREKVFDPNTPRTPAKDTLPPLEGVFDERDFIVR
jgi:hypothetical protein